jgi:hypothetical protein
MNNGFEPQEVIATTTVALDGLESSVRNRATHLTDLIGQAMLKTVPEASLDIRLAVIEQMRSQQLKVENTNNKSLN